MPNKHKCDDCGAVVTDAKLKTEIKDFAQRVDPGGVVPSGECRKCGALVYPMMRLFGAARRFTKRRLTDGPQR